MENELLGPPSGESGDAPPWWKKGATVIRKVDGQAGKASFTSDGKPLVLIERGLMGTMRIQAEVEDWEPDLAAKFLTLLQIAKISYEADRAFLQATGVPNVPEWMALGENAKLHWQFHVLKGDQFSGHNAEARSRLAMAIVAAMKVEI